MMKSLKIWVIMASIMFLAGICTNISFLYSFGGGALMGYSLVNVIYD